jgi:transcription initiation factor TFIID subunit 7
MLVQATAQHANKVLEEVEEEIVDYEPWMDDFGRQPAGIDLDAQDQLCSLHPEVWLPQERIREIRQKEEEDAQHAFRKKQAAAEKKEKKKNKKKKAASADSGPSIKKGIPAKKKEEVVDEVTLAASLMMTEGAGEFDLGDDDLLDFDLDDMENL